MAKHVVDHLEAIQVDVQHCDLGLGPVGEPGLEFTERGIAVHQSGQRIAARLHAQGFLGLLALGDVLQGAADPGRGRAVAHRFAERTYPEVALVRAHALQLQIELRARLQRGLHGQLQAHAIDAAQAAGQLAHGSRGFDLADDALRFVGEVERIAGAIPLPAADVRQRLDAVEHGTVALDRRHVAEEREHLVRAARPGRELRHHGHREPDHLPPLPVLHPHQRAFDDATGVHGPGCRILLQRHRRAVLAQHEPVFVAHRLGQRLPVADPQDAQCGRVAVNMAPGRVLDHDALVDQLHQLAVADLGFLALAQVARHRHEHVLAPFVMEVGRMHLHREPAAVGTHVGHFDDIGVAAAQGVEHRQHVVARQVRVEHVDGLAHDFLARPVVGPHAGAVEVEHGAVEGDDADRVGHRIEQRAITQAFCLDFAVRTLDGRSSAVQQLACFRAERGIAGGAPQCPEQAGRVGRGVFPALRGWPARGHAAARALPALLPVSRPSRPASHRPVFASMSRSIPVPMPRPCSMYTTSSLATLPLAPLA